MIIYGGPMTTLEIPKSHIEEYSKLTRNSKYSIDFICAVYMTAAFVQSDHVQTDHPHDQREPDLVLSSWVGM